MGRLPSTCLTSIPTAGTAHNPATQGHSTPRRTVQAETDDGPITLTLAFVKTLGRGRGARVDLVHDLRTNRLIAEKVFGFGRGISSLITNALYRLFYQASFPYRTTASAVWTAYYRRKAVRLLTEYWFGAPCVADALYVRWDAEANAFILGTEYIAGRGPRVSPPDAYALHRWLRARSLPPRPVEEMDTLVAFMDRLRSHLRESGFIGTQWQVDRRTLVATANFLRDGGRWIAVDLESGVPAVTMPRYLWQGLRLGRFPLFDDTDFSAVWSYVDRHADALAQHLGAARAHHLRHMIKELEAQEHLWKAGEVALLREPRRWTRPDGRAHIRQQTLDRWVQEGRLSPQSARIVGASTLRFLGHWVFGGIVSRARHWARFIGDLEYRATVVSPHVAAWVEAGRLQPDTGMWLTRHPHLLPLGILAFSALLPPSLVRFLRDPQYRAVALRCAYRTVVDESYQLFLAERFITRRIEEWGSAGRLTSEESDVLRRAVATPSAQEYVRGFGVHLALKALLPSALLDPLFIGAALTTGSMYPLVLFFIRSLAITAYTLTRWIKCPELRFGTALAIGLVP
ncbi:MAG: hypothetical protein HYZ72_13650 [Deltaproteobacteria bacterium]|nr:hypothetical protein [Deltaproteobacteria bacterium]